MRACPRGDTLREGADGSQNEFTVYRQGAGGIEPRVQICQPPETGVRRDGAHPCGPAEGGQRRGLQGPDGQSCGAVPGPGYDSGADCLRERRGTEGEGRIFPQGQESPGGVPPAGGAVRPERDGDGAYPAGDHQGGGERGGAPPQHHRREHTEAVCGYAGGHGPGRQPVQGGSGAQNARKGTPVHLKPVQQGSDRHGQGWEAGSGHRQGG